MLHKLLRLQFSVSPPNSWKPLSVPERTCTPPWTTQDEQGQCWGHSCVHEDSLQQKQTSWSWDNQSSSQMGLTWPDLNVSLHILQTQLIAAPQDNRSPPLKETPEKVTFPKSWLERSQNRCLPGAEVGQQRGCGGWSPCPGDGSVSEPEKLLDCHS